MKLNEVYTMYSPKKSNTLFLLNTIRFLYNFVEFFLGIFASGKIAFQAMMTIRIRFVIKLFTPAGGADGECYFIFIVHYSELIAQKTTLFQLYLIGWLGGGK